MAPNMDVPVYIPSEESNRAIPFKDKNDEPTNTKSFVEPNVGETISLASKREQRIRNNSKEGASPGVGTIAKMSYELDRYSKNAMLVIHNDCCKLSDRTADKVRTTFEKFRFEVEIHNNKSRDEILAVLNEFFSRDFTEYGIAAVVVISPSEPDGSYVTRGGSGRTMFTKEEMLRYFNTGVVPTLEGKPKIFLSESSNANIKLYTKEQVDNKKDVFEYSTANSTPTYPPRVDRRSKIMRYPLHRLCEKLENLADTKNFVDIVLETSQKTWSLQVRGRTIQQVIPAQSMGSLEKELWLSRTTA